MRRLALLICLSIKRTERCSLTGLFLTRRASAPSCSPASFLELLYHSFSESSGSRTQLSMSSVDSKTKSRCGAPGCENRTYSSPSNLKRHIKAKHNQAVEMLCGKSFPNHPSNIKRHMDSCGCVVQVQPLLPAVGHGVGMTNTTNTTTTLTFDVTHMILNDFNNECYSVDSIYFGPF